MQEEKAGDLLGADSETGYLVRRKDLDQSNRESKRTVEGI